MYIFASKQIKYLDTTYFLDNDNRCYVSFFFQNFRQIDFRTAQFTATVLLLHHFLMMKLGMMTNAILLYNGHKNDFIFLICVCMNAFV